MPANIRVMHRALEKQQQQQQQQQQQKERKKNKNKGPIPTHPCLACIWLNGEMDDVATCQKNRIVTG